MVRIQILGQEAIIDGRKWQSGNPLLADLLTAYLPRYGASPSDPNPDLTAATAVIDIFGGEILEADEVEHVPGRIY